MKHISDAALAFVQATIARQKDEAKTDRESGALMDEPEYQLYDPEYEPDELYDPECEPNERSHRRPRASRETVLRAGYVLTDDEYEAGIGDLFLYGDV
ncbi:hypothetical protein FACS189487_00380 [Campylobacterota bacterium]|nr:hypothetical protein FACS189487_00380 [Campylobacterota bacterium]